MEATNVARVGGVLFFDVRKVLQIHFHGAYALALIKIAALSPCNLADGVSIFQQYTTSAKRLLKRKDIWITVPTWSQIDEKELWPKRF